MMVPAAASTRKAFSVSAAMTGRLWPPSTYTKSTSGTTVSARKTSESARNCVMRRSNGVPRKASPTRWRLVVTWRWSSESSSARVAPCVSSGRSTVKIRVSSGVFNAIAYALTPR